MNLGAAERALFRATRLFTLAAVAASFIGALLMFYLGVGETFAAFALQFGGERPADSPLPKGELTVLTLMNALDRFLIGMVLLFFSYGVYGLFVRPDRTAAELGLPDWMHVEHIGQLKQTIAEVIIIVLFVLFCAWRLRSFTCAMRGRSPNRRDSSCSRLQFCSWPPQCGLSGLKPRTPLMPNPAPKIGQTLTAARLARVATARNE